MWMNANYQASTQDTVMEHLDIPIHAETKEVATPALFHRANPR